MQFPNTSNVETLKAGPKRLLICAYGFEERSLGWAKYQSLQGTILTDALIFLYKHSKGRNRISELRQALSSIGIKTPIEITYDTQDPRNIERRIEKQFFGIMSDYDEIILDISAMTKLLILVCLCKLEYFTGTIRIVYSEANEYAPTQDAYEKSKVDMELIARFPSRGFESIIRMKCLTSIRMQGQPVTMVAFTSFNEQLVRHMLGTINPHRLLFINGKPHRQENKWREMAMQEIHQRLISEYKSNNPEGEDGLLLRSASTLEYIETIQQIEAIYTQVGMHERIICASTGNKMQTVGLFFSKVMHPDIHIEYPTPDSYYVSGMSTGVREIFEIVIREFSDHLKSLI